MIRVLSALVLLPIVVATIWLLPPVATLVLAEIVLLLGFIEYVALARRMGARIPAVVTGAAALATAVAVSLPEGAAAAALMAATIAVGLLAVGAARADGQALRDASAAMFAPLYLGLPLGALAAIRMTRGREALLLLLATIVASDTAQYYSGRLFGRRPLAPGISPKKTVEGALGGLVAGTIVMAVGGRAWLQPPAETLLLALLGGGVVGFGIAGDLFESLLKRQAGLKDASGLIPGHGGMLDRIDSLLFAAPVYYLFLRFAI